MGGLQHWESIKRPDMYASSQVSPDFKLYKEGVYDSRVCRSGPDNVNHAVSRPAMMCGVVWGVTCHSRRSWR
jgi:hypothetical protein